MPHSTHSTFDTITFCSGILHLFSLIAQTMPLVCVWFLTAQCNSGSGLKPVFQPLLVLTRTVCERAAVEEVSDLGDLKDAAS